LIFKWLVKFYSIGLPLMQRAPDVSGQRPFYITLKAVVVVPVPQVAEAQA
jgi:hypothetical protein